MHLRLLFVVFSTVVFGLVAGGAGCTTLTGTEGQPVEYLTAEVDSLVAPARIAPTDTLKVRMRGTVGPNSCYQFERFSVTRSTDRLTVTPVVRHTTAADVACLTVVVPLNRTYVAAPPFAEGSLTVTVPQPDQPDVTTSVRVTDGQ
jgi:hypothetical protein